MRDDDPLKILFVIGTLGRGGAESQLCRLAVELQRRGHRVVVATLSDGGPLAIMLQSEGVPLHVLAERRDGRPRIVGLFVLGRATLRLMRLMRRERPHVCHAWLWWSYVIALPLAAACRVPARLIALRALIQPKEKSYPRMFVSALGRRLSHGVTANSQAIADEATALRLVPAKIPIRVIHNAIDVPGWTAAPGTNPPTVVCVANLIRYKGHRTVFDAWRQLAEPPVLLLVGDGPERAELVELVEQLGLGAVVRFVGSVEDASQYVRSSQISILPSTTEGFPNAVLEAMAAGLPVVASRVGGIPELVDETCSILVEPRDAGALASAIQRLIDDATLRVALGSAGRRRAKCFTWERCAISYEELYRERLDN